MKNYFVIYLLLMSFSLFAQDKKSIETKISTVTLFLNGAEITREGKTELKKGRNEIAFINISPGLDPKSVRVTTNPDLSVLSISTKIDHLTKVKIQPRIQELKDSLDLLNSKKSGLTDELDAYKTEKDLLLKNISLGGEDNGVAVSEIKLAANFYRTRITEINNKLSELSRSNEKVEREIKKINRQLRELNANLNYPRSIITMLVDANKTITTNIEIKYFVNNAGWAPVYEIKALDINNPVELNYRANVFNNTDIDWKDTKLILSTADPKLTATRPDLNPWYLNLRTYRSASNAKFQKKEGYVQNRIMQSEAIPMEMDLAQAPMPEVAEFIEVALSEFSSDFEIKEAYTIPSDGKPYIVEVAYHKLPAVFSYSSVPKIDRDAFIMARIAGWEDLELIEGPANIYFGGSYIGESYINTRNVKDTLDISLGRDKKILVTRSKLKKYSSKKLIGSKEKEILAYEIIVKNNRKYPIDIEVLDQVPVSQNSEIEVDVIEISGANHNISSGELKWKLHLEPSGSKKLRLTFAIKHPKNTIIPMQQSRTRAIRKF